MSPFDAAVVLGPSGGQHIEGKVEILAGGLELGPELRPSVDCSEVTGKGIS